MYVFKKYKKLKSINQNIYKKTLKSWHVDVKKETKNNKFKPFH